MNPRDSIELNEQFIKALDIMENTSRNVFITGRAGTGKSTLLDYFRNHTKKHVAVLAPTGVAAVNISGQTIHSFFAFPAQITSNGVKENPPSPKQKQLWKKLNAIVIDEISMVRADLLDCVDLALRLGLGKKQLPFGGLQMIFIGDLYQLPPVVAGREERELFCTHYQSPYFFDARVFNTPGFSIEFIELEKIYRQKDIGFISILNKIRNNSVVQADLDSLNKQYNPDFKTGKELFITLTSTNAAADSINEFHLSRIHSKLYVAYGEISGRFDEKSLPTAKELHLKKGAQVMLLNNDREKRWINGTLAEIVDIEKSEEGSDAVVVELENGGVEEVTPYTWEMYHYFFDRKKNSLDVQTIGSFTQYPLRLAWAITIHKSQGKTFDRVIVDMDRTFAHGQAYVALSRCRTLEGMILKRKVQKGHILMDWRVVKFITKYQYEISDKKCPLENKISLIKKAIAEKKKIKVIYLKNNDIKSKRIIEPHEIGTMEYCDKEFLGVRAFCDERQEERTFRIDRILEIEEIQ